MTAASTSQSAYARFAFDTVFDTDGHVIRSATRKNELLNLEEVAALEAQAYERGLNDATALATQALADAVSTLSKLTQMVLGRLSTEASSLRTDAVDVAIAAARAVAGCALDHYGDDVVLAAVNDAVAQMRHTPRLLVRVAPSLESQLAPRLTDMAERAGFAGALVVRSDPSVQVGDVSLEWADGSIRLDRASAFETIEAAAMRWLATADQDEAQLDLFGIQQGAKA